jgi:replicative DNA helicase
MPHSVEAEQAVLGAMMIDARRIPDVLSELRPEDFYVPLNRDIYDAILGLSLDNAVVDSIMVIEALRMRGQFEEPATRDYILEMVNVTPSASNVMQYARIVRDRSLLRQIADAAGEISARAVRSEGESEAALDYAEQRMLDVRKGRQSGELFSVSQVMLEVYERLDELAKNKGKLPGLPTGMSELDMSIGGLGNSNLILVASRPGMGKTSIALNIAYNAAKAAGKSVVFFTLEMSRVQLVMRLLSSVARIDSKTLLMGTLSDAQWRDIASASSILSNMPILFDDNPAVTVAEIKAKCRRVKNLGLIVIDYLQLMQGSSGRNENRVQEVSGISRQLKIMAKELDVPVLCLSQLSRANEKRENKRPQLSDLRESGAIEQDADVVLFLYRDEYYHEDSEEKDSADVIIAKNRFGETGKIKMHWEGQFTTFTSQDYGHE